MSQFCRSLRCYYTIPSNPWSVEDVPMPTQAHLCHFSWTSRLSTKDLILLNHSWQMPNTKISQIFIVISLSMLTQVPKFPFSVGELSRPEVSKSFSLINITKAHEPQRVVRERLFVPQKKQKWPAIPCWLFSSPKNLSNPLHPTALKKQCAKEREQLLCILIPPQLGCGSWRTTASQLLRAAPSETLC